MSVEEIKRKRKEKKLVTLRKIIGLQILLPYQRGLCLWWKIGLHCFSKVQNIKVIGWINKKVKKAGDIGEETYLYLYLCIYLSIYLSVYLSNYLSVCPWREGEREEFILRGWLMPLWQFGESKIWSSKLAAWRLGKSCGSGNKVNPLEEFFLAAGRSVFVLLRPSAIWMRQTHITEGNLLYSKFINLNVNLIHTTPSQKTSKIIFNQIPGHCGLARWTQKLTITDDFHRCSAL